MFEKKCNLDETVDRSNVLKQNFLLLFSNIKEHFSKMENKNTKVLPNQ